ncbi:leucine-rich repeat domain-containing protein [Flavivirga spongiicola]|uniref:Leucine-rich repeat domain-containing protein n=1 Tax=Flavivirga spongiicola TaxID=421621 RepID=A0ABU7XW53_9FLAO|nr:leucine-rich repeat domain-containing protein [Flavivirga sp. MEBiC05379]MDO5980006.1 leucine-rich repeat domain-containing protein [Flavivirga sp. MEBiC05379]
MRKLFFLYAFLLVALSSIGQNVNIPDNQFKKALLSSNCIDSDGDGKPDSDVDINNDNKIQINEIKNIEFLNVSFKDITSLEGIQEFENLKKLYCHDNQLKNLDVSKNKNLEVLYCYDNQITHLNLKKNKNLKKLGVRDNKLTKLDLSKNKKLEVLYCYKNLLTSLNIKNGNNVNMGSMWSYDNPNLTSIKVDNENNTYPICDKSNYKGWCKDPNTSYNNKTK